ncbi:catalase [Pedobacter ginsenosidimutans]|uniref:Catalase n=1 Tax=Pedobacter ginsenosidimutans TaxID=687842 RepID=A0A0T5VXE5_9SPHI|nr:catalase [Pedobacter ginsenosidimutans]KRT17861.1 catalase [Pedobacter ginsenosidimutans]
MNKKIPLLIIYLCFASLTYAQQKTLTTNTGVPIGDNQNSKTIGNNGAVLLEDINLLEKLAAFDRERIPERVVHARGAGAFGTFTSAADFSAYTMASLFSLKGKATPVFVRFSTVIHGNGSPETLRDPRGFAVKFYTDQGNYDLVGNNLPVFFIRDAIKFPDMVHSLKPSPITNRQDPNRFFDFFSHIPESTHMLTRLYTTLGIPSNYRQMDGSSVHAFKWINKEGAITYVKYTWKTKQGVKGLTAQEAELVQGKDFQHATNDLYDHIKTHDFPSWDLYVQMLKPEDFEHLDFNPLDATKIWPEKDTKSILVGTMTLNKIPDNFFEQVEESAFSPGDLVPGIEPSEDKLLQGRLFSYFDTQRYRIGANFQSLKVNAPMVPVHSYNQDGALSNQNKTSDVNYQPNTSDKEYTDNGILASSSKINGSTATVRHQIDKPENFKQAGDFYRSLPENEKLELIKNLTGDLSAVKNRSVALKMVGYFYMADADFGKKLASVLKISREEAESTFSNH